MVVLFNTYGLLVVFFFLYVSVRIYARIYISFNCGLWGMMPVFGVCDGLCREKDKEQEGGLS